MLRKLENALTSTSDVSLAKTFWRLGWIGFWTQIGFGAIPVILTIYALVLGRNAATGTRGGISLIEYLTFADGLVLPIYPAWPAAGRSGAAPVATCLTASCVDRGCGKRTGHHFFNDGDVI
jgi:Protein of unknown function (DUF3611)